MVRASACLASPEDRSRQVLEWSSQCLKHGLNASRGFAEEVNFGEVPDSFVTPAAPNVERTVATLLIVHEAVREETGPAFQVQMLSLIR